MRVLLLSDWMSVRGGAESYILSLRQALRDQGDDVCLVTCGPGSSGDGDERAFGTNARAAQTFLQIVNPFAVAKVSSAVSEHRPDVALVSQFAYHLSPAVLSALEPVPTVVSMMDYKAICPLGTRLLPDSSVCGVPAGFECSRKGCVSVPHWLRDRPRYAFMARRLRRARRVLCPSEAMKKALGVAGIEARVIPLGVEPPGALVQAATFPVFVYSGRLSREKGPALMIAAFAAISPDFPEARARIVGDGPLRAELEALTATFGVADRVEFTGWVSEDHVALHSGDAWATVCPSLWAEPFGIAAVSSILRGVPVIASDSGGFLETVESGVSGIHFRTGNIASLASAMREIASGSVFPSHRLEDTVVAQAAADYRLLEHAARVRDVFRELVA